MVRIHLTTDGVLIVIDNLGGFLSFLEVRRSMVCLTISSISDFLEYGGFFDRCTNDSHSLDQDSQILTLS